MTNAVDAYIGARVRMTREFRGVSQAELARALGLSLTWLQLREQGRERFGARHLISAGQLLAVNPAFFFNGLDDMIRLESVGAAHAGPRATGENDNSPSAGKDRVRGLQALVTTTQGSG